VSSRSDSHLSTAPAIRMMCHTVQTPDRPSIIRLDNVGFRLDPSLYREAFVPAWIRSDVSAARPNASQYLTKLQILSKFIYGKIDATVRPTWIPVRTRFSLRQESQFKFYPSDASQHGPDACSTDMEIADWTSTVRTPAFHGPDARTVNMEIACWRSTVRTAIPFGSDARSLIWKLLAADMRLSGRSASPSGRGKDFHGKSQKFWSHSCPSGRLRFTVRMSSIHITAVVHLNP
jgi:hypothetical protein